MNKIRVIEFAAGAAQPKKIIQSAYDPIDCTLTLTYSHMNWDHDIFLLTESENEQLEYCDNNNLKIVWSIEISQLIGCMSEEDAVIYNLKYR